MQYQRYNVGLALFMTESYLKSINQSFSITDEIARSLGVVQLLGKSQVVKEKGITWFISSGHNEVGVSEAMSWFKQAIESSQYVKHPMER